MLYYNAKVGYVESTNPTISNISVITWTDNTKFIINTLSTGLDDFSTSGEISDVFSSYEQIVGDDTNVLYAMPMYNYSPSDAYLKYKAYFPSMFLSTPTAWSLAPEHSNYRWFLYVPTLKRLFTNHDGYAFMYMSSVDPATGSVSYISNFSVFGFSYYSTSAGTDIYYNLASVVNYTNPEDLINPEKAVRLQFFIRNGKNYGYLKYTNVTVASELVKLFGTSPSEPDGSIISPPNPYEPGGDSGEGGGGGTFDDNSDPIPIPPLPTLSSADTGFTRIYNPTLAQVKQLSEYLWTTPDIIDTIWNHIKQFFENPMDAIIGFNLVPVPVPDGGTENFKLMFIDTGVSMTAAASQFVDVDCGTLQIKEYYGSALDYAPYTKITCFLPYIGAVTLDTDEVMGSTIQVKYRVDICAGTCVCYVVVGGSVLYQYSGHCAINIPFSAADFSSYVSAAISAAKLAGAAVAAGMGVAAGAAESVAAQQTGQVVTAVSGTIGDAPVALSVAETVDRPTGSTTQSSFAGISPANVSNTVGQVMGSKPHIEHSGAFSGNSGYLGVRRPYVVIERPRMCMPAGYQQYNGFPSMITSKLGDLSGYTKVQQCMLTECPATNPEQAEILELLKGGVIF